MKLYKNNKVIRITLLLNYLQLSAFILFMELVIIEEIVKKLLWPYWWEYSRNHMKILIMLYMKLLSRVILNALIQDLSQVPIGIRNTFLNFQVYFTIAKTLLKNF